MESESGGFLQGMVEAVALDRIPDWAYHTLGDVDDGVGAFGRCANEGREHNGAPSLRCSSSYLRIRNDIESDCFAAYEEEYNESRRDVIRNLFSSIELPSWATSVSSSHKLSLWCAMSFLSSRLAATNAS
jgi:hypothetical protein